MGLLDEAITERNKYINAIDLINYIAYVSNELVYAVVDFLTFNQLNHAVTSYYSNAKIEKCDEHIRNYLREKWQKQKTNTGDKRFYKRMISLAENIYRDYLENTDFTNKGK